MIEFDKYQNQAINACLSNKYKKVFISGVAGSGKSAIINYIKKEFDENKIKYNVVAPTNMASRNVGGKTLHSEFSLLPNKNIEAKSEDEFIIFDNFADDEDKLSQYDRVLIVDEVSMVGKKLLSKTLDNAIYTKMILFGDLEQLPPVKDKKVDYTKYVDKHIHLKNNYRATNKQVSQWIAEFRDTHKLNPNIPKFNLNMFDEDTYIIGYTNKAISKMEKELIKYSNHTKVVLFSPIYKNGDKVYDNGDSVRLLKVSNYQLDLDDIVEELLGDDDLDFFTIHEKIYLKLRVFDIDDEWGDDRYPNACIVGDYELYKKVLDIRFKNFIKVLKNLMSVYNKSKKELWEMYRKDKLNSKDKESLANVYKKYMSIKFKPFARHSQFITSYKAQGKAYKKVVVLKNDIPNSDNMYVAISRAVEELYIY